jgi:hypothetical protein
VGYGVGGLYCDVVTVGVGAIAHDRIGLPGRLEGVPKRIGCAELKAVADIVGRYSVVNGAIDYEETDLSSGLCHRR